MPIICRADQSAAVRDAVRDLAAAEISHITNYTYDKIAAEYECVVRDGIARRLRDAVTVHVTSDSWEHIGHHFCGVLAFALEVVRGRFKRSVLLVGMPVYDNASKRDAAAAAHLLDFALEGVELPRAELPRVFLSDAAGANPASLRESDVLQGAVLFPCAGHQAWASDQSNDLAGTFGTFGVRLTCLNRVGIGCDEPTKRLSHLQPIIGVLRCALIPICAMRRI
jgi:hypothetical protein